MRKVIFGLIAILITLPVYAIDRNLQMKGIEVLKNAGICASVKVSKGEPYCIVDCKKIHGKDICFDIKRKECKWAVEGYVEGNFLKYGQINSVVIVNDDCSAHAGGFGETVFITDSKAIIFPYKRWDHVNSLFVLKGKDGRDRVLMTGESYHQGYYFGGISICNFARLQEKFYSLFKHPKGFKEIKIMGEEEEKFILEEDCKDVESLEDVKTFTDKGDIEFKVAMVPITSKPENYVFEVRVQKLVNERVVETKRCSLKYQWNGVNLITSAENKKCLETVKKYLPKTEF
jgi:hypothetical protein